MDRDETGEKETSCFQDMGLEKISFNSVAVLLRSDRGIYRGLTLEQLAKNKCIGNRSK